MPTVNDLPPLIAGLIVGFYWARVVKLAIKTRRKQGQSAHFLPPEPLGRAVRVAWYPTVLLWIALPLVGGLWLNAPPPLRPDRSIPVMHWSGVVLAAACLYLTMICWRRMGRHWRMGIDPGEKNQLLVNGPFAFVRHPIYALSSVMALATLAAAPSPTLAVVVALHVLFLRWEARREEAHLLALHGEPYLHYLRHVGRFVPRSLHAYQPPIAPTTEANPRH